MIDRCRSRSAESRRGGINSARRTETGARGRSSPAPERSRPQREGRERSDEIRPLLRLLDFHIAVRPALPAQGAEQPLATGKGKVVVVEDNPDARQLLAMSLTDLGFSVQGFDSAEAALEALPHLAPDIMVADIGLPGMDGVELLLRSRQLPGLSDLPAIAATAWGQPEDALRIRQAGFDDHFVKPFDVQELVDRISERIAERQGSAWPGAAPLQG